MKIDHRCRWVRHRLPLLAGGELEVNERRKVERHLIGCSGCQDLRESSANVLAVLRSTAAEPPSQADAPSLWPALARQIRQSRHVAARPSWWDLPLPRPWASLSLAAGLGAVLVASLAQPTERVDEPVAPSVVVTQTPAVEVEPEVAIPLLPAPAGALPGPINGLAQNPVKPIEPPSASLQFDYDLDHGTPMSPGNRDPQRTF